MRIARNLVQNFVDRTGRIALLLLLYFCHYCFKYTGFTSSTEVFQTRNELAVEMWLFEIQ